MKESNLLTLVYICRRQLALASVLLSAFFLSRPSQAAYTYIPGTAALNVYFANGGSVYPGEFNPNPDLFGGGPCTQVSPAHLNPGSELTPPYFFSSSLPGALGGLSYPSYSSGTMTLGTATASVTYFATPFFIGTNTLTQSSATPYFGQVNLANTGSTVAELRLDWTAQFTYSGTTPIAPFAGALVDFNLGDWVAVSGSLTFYDITTSTASSVTVPLGGDYAFHGYPSALSTYAPAGQFWGYESPYTSGFSFANIGATGSTLSPTPGDTIETVGYLDFVTDPGSMQASIIPAPPPVVHQASFSGTNLLVNVLNAVAGVSYVTCRSTDVSAPLNTWQPVATNIAGATGNLSFIANNVVNPSQNAAFFVIRAE